jgi:hypothetical protein
MAGSELEGARKTVSEYRDSGQAFDTDVKHQIWITNASEDHAVIVDHFTSTELLLDPSTKEPRETTPRVENRRDTFVLQLMNGVWKVVDEP